jgi:hypothetical protein
MALRFVGYSLMLCGLACASTTTTIVQMRSVWSTDQTEVSELGPGHYGGRWTNHAIDIYNLGQRGEEIFVCTESGILDLVYSGPYVVSSCANKSTKICKHRDGTRTADIMSTCKAGPDGLLVFEGQGSIVRATGRFEGIQAKSSFTAWQVVPGPHDYGYTQATEEIVVPRN